MNAPSSSSSPSSFIRPTRIFSRLPSSVHSSTASLTSNGRVPGIRYPSVSGTQNERTMDSRYREENERHRVEEMLNDSDRRVEMHLNEIRMLKEETRRMKGMMEQLQDERDKARQLAKEWIKFGKYTSDLMKEETRAYQMKVREANSRLRVMSAESEELKQLCLYLDEQRQAARQSCLPPGGCGRLDAESDDQGCGSSEKSTEEEEERRGAYCLKKETSLRRLSDRVNRRNEGEESEGSHDRLFSYIQSLENRIKHLERNDDGMRRESSLENSSWRSSVTSEGDDLTVMEREIMGGREWREECQETSCDERKREMSGERTDMGMSTCTMTSSGTTFCSSEADDMASSAVFVDGSSEQQPFPHLEVRSLPPIEEERKEDLSHRLSAEIVQSAMLPPCIQPVSSKTMSMGRYRAASADRVSDVGVRIPDSNLRQSDPIRLPSREPSTISEAVDILRMRESKTRLTPLTQVVYSTWKSPDVQPRNYLTAL